jgi:GH24 family phage-related lysozyme (muramidase)
LVSLAYNRGASFSAPGERFLEMRNIRQHMEAKAFALIPGEFRAMKRIWAGDPNLAGLLVRRDAEAALFERGLAMSST